MDKPKRHDLADTVGTDVGRSTMMKEIVAKVEGLDATSSDEDLDLWWGSVEIDRLASGLTLAAIAKLSDPSSDDDPPGPWLRRSDATGDAVTRLTAEGRKALRQISAAGDAGQDQGAAAADR